MKNYIALIIIIFFVKCAFSQSISKSLFLVVDRQTDTIIQHNENSNVKIKYYHVNKSKNWNLGLRHINSPNNFQNNFRYLLPKEMVSELERKGNLEDIKPFMIKLNNYNNKEVSQFFSKHYSYYYEYLQKGRKKTYKRYNIFIIFKSDLEKTFVPCYEMTLLKSRITEI
ncbi:hypothetical protein [Psychroflexus sp. ALD_RP9]|uniref:hypothetical protein n=1 Tax=Psychroflexus sp. ALD_RP9 TaxID=2777186 RepID=UPI001A8C5F71|nr:hypothetical protein [Psychroflexus sp. ALD_RP9]QSS98051.1 hypothetical protein IMZ30_04880 [Psychroflexus sp. ALD_RP9]